MPVAIYATHCAYWLKRKGLPKGVEILAARPLVMLKSLPRGLDIVIFICRARGSKSAKLEDTPVFSISRTSLAGLA